MDVAVVGSGVSGISVAHALIERGLTVTLLDVGETLDPLRQSVVAKLHDLPTSSWPAEDFALINENATRGLGLLPKKVFFGSEAIYADERPFARLTALAKGRVPYPTFAKGGFSNIWGAAVLPVDQCDMADWPVSRAEMDVYFKKVAALMPICGDDATLGQAFPSYKDVLGDLDPSPQGNVLLDDLKHAAAALAQAGTLFGKARLAIHTTATDGDILPCNNCGHCFTGCVRGSIFSTTPLLDRMIRAGLIRYRSNIYIESVDESDGKAKLQAIDLSGGQRTELSFDAIFLAAGPLNTTRLLLRSRELYDRTVPLKESQKFAIPMLRLRGAQTAIAHPAVTLASVFIETKVPDLSDHWVHLQVMPLYDLILDGAHLPGIRSAAGQKLWSPLLERVMIGWCGMHSDHSARVELTLRRDDVKGDRLELGLQETEEARSAGRRVARELLRKGLKFRTLFLPFMTKFANPGSGTHCGASFPMRRNPRDFMDSDALGRPFGWTRIFAADSSVLPSIPGTTLAFSVMANAYRIGVSAPL